MAKPTITYQYSLPAGVVPKQIAGSVRLAAYISDDPSSVASFTTSAGASMIGSIPIKLDASGFLRVDDGTTAGAALILNPNNGSSSDAIINPAASVYHLILSRPGGRTEDFYFRVPDQSGSVALTGLIITPQIGVVQAPDGVPSLKGPGAAGLYGGSLATFRAGLLNRLVKPCNVGILGDSITVGYWASAMTTTYADMLAKSLYDFVAQTVPTGYISLHSLCSYVAPKVFAFAGTTADDNNSGWGYGARSLTPTAGIASITQTFDRLWVHFPDVQFNGQFRVRVAGSLVGSTIVPVADGSVSLGGRIWDSGSFGSVASRAVAIEPIDGLGFPSIVEGITFFSGNGNTSGAIGRISAANANTGTGLRVHKMGHFGYHTGQFDVTSATSCDWEDAITSGYVPLKLLIIMLGTNDQNVSFARTPAQYSQSLQTIVARVNAAHVASGNPIPSYLFVSPYGVGVDNTVTPHYRQALYEAAEASNAAILDIYNAFGGFVGTPTADVNGFTSSLDGSTRIHPSDLGMANISASIGGFLRNAIGYVP